MLRLHAQHRAPYYAVLHRLRASRCPRDEQATVLRRGRHGAARDPRSSRSRSSDPSVISRANATKYASERGSPAPRHDRGVGTPPAAFRLLEQLLALEIGLEGRQRCGRRRPDVWVPIAHLEPRGGSPQENRRARKARTARPPRARPRHGVAEPDDPLQAQVPIHSHDISNDIAARSELARDVGRDLRVGAGAWCSRRARRTTAPASAG